MVASTRQPFLLKISTIRNINPNNAGTLPHELNGLCLHNPRFMYDLLLRAAWYTLSTFAADPKWLGAKTASTMVLHTPMRDRGQALGTNPSLAPTSSLYCPEWWPNFNWTMAVPKARQCPISLSGRSFENGLQSFFSEASTGGLGARVIGFTFRLPSQC